MPYRVLTDKVPSLGDVGDEIDEVLADVNAQALVKAGHLAVVEATPEPFDPIDGEWPEEVDV